VSEKPASKPRIYADFNSCMGDGRGEWCWLLRYKGILLDEVSPSSLVPYEGMPVILYYEDPGEEFEVNAILGHVTQAGWDDRWMALPDWTTMRRLRG
jgi:hypothetical protein